MNDENAPVVWITGASSGLGRSLALQLARQGQHVIASARNRTELDRLAAEESNIEAVECDISDKKSLQKAIEKITGLVPALDQVILNAGNCEYLDFPDPDWDAVRRVMEINFFGTVNCVEAVLPLLRKNHHRAHIVAVASQVTAAPFPRAEAYGASKAAMQYFFESLRIDLASENIEITVVNPGFVDTPLTRKNDFDMPFLMQSDEAARRIAKNIATRPRSYSFPLRLSALLRLSKLFPGLWQKILAASPNPRNTQSNQGAGK